MNEQIDRLLRLANIKDDDGYNTTDLTTSLQLFAELIIYECCDVVINSDPSEKTILYEPYSTIMDNIIDYFGIEK